MNNSITTNEQIDWEPILIKLTAYTHAITKKKPWFRGIGTDTFLKGKKVEDYVYEAIGRYLQEPKKYNLDKGKLLEYLKLNLIRSLVGNDLRKQENWVTDTGISNSFENDDENDSYSYLDKIHSFTEAQFEDVIDYTAVRTFIEKEIDGDSIAENIFLAVYDNNMKRRETIEEFDMTLEQYDNGMRRLKTVIKRAELCFNNKK